MQSNDKQAQLDLQLIAAVSAGDTDALGTLYDRHGRRLLGVAIAILGNERDAEDLLHDVFMELWQKADTYDRNRGPVLYWLLLRIRSRAIDRQRALRVKDERQHQASLESAVTKPAVCVNWDAVETMEYLMALPNRQRDLLMMNYIQGYTCREIAELTDVPIGTIKSRLQSALRTLREQVAEVGCQ